MNNNKNKNDIALLKIRSLKGYNEITEKDFYPPEDKRLYSSIIKDINNGDTFEDYVKYFYDQYENELFDN